ncbi:MAG: YfhO family protein, partial [Butyrivibrio sp.]|nr:YfhO family protein [Butyrivibrio sp.]
NPMWLDAILLLPLLTLWTEELMMDETWLDMTDSIETLMSTREAPGHVRGFVRVMLGTALLICLNYYIAWMILLFLALRCLLLLITGDSSVGCAIRTLGAALAGTVLTLPFLLPTIRALMTSFRLHPTQNDLYALPAPTPLQLLYNMLPLHFELSQLMEGAPVLYCGCGTLVLSLIFYGCLELPLRVRIRQLILFLVLLVSFMTPLNLLWHGGQYPQGYPYRFTFLWLFLTVESAGCAWEEFSLWRLEAWENRLAKRAGETAEGAQQTSRPRRRLWPLFCAVLSLCLLAELGSNAVLIYHRMSWQQCTMLVWRSYLSRMDALQDLLQTITATDTDTAEAPGIYRMENLSPREENDALGFGYAGVTHYGSEMRASTRAALHALGYPENGLYTAFDTNNTSTAMSLLGLQYLINPEAPIQESILNVGTALPMAWVVATPAQVLRLQVAALTDYRTAPKEPFALQTELLSLAQGGSEEAAPAPFVPAVILEDDAQMVPELAQDGTTHPVRRRRIDFKAAADGDLYFCMAGLGDDYYNLELSMDGSAIGGYGNLSANGVRRLDTFAAGEIHELVIRSEADFPGTPFFYTEDMSALEAAAAQIQANAGCLQRAHHGLSLPLISCGDSHLQATVPAVTADGRTACIVLLNLPYEDNWVVRSADGARLEHFSVGDLFTAVVLPEPAETDAAEEDAPGAEGSSAQITLYLNYRP